MKPTTAMVILAAGASSRMQAIKQLLPWKNTTLLGNAIAQGLQSNVEEVYVVLGANATQIKQSILNYSVKIIENPNWEKGIGSSIACAITYFKNNNLYYEAVLISLADQPLINADYYNSLIQLFLTNTKPIIASQINNKAGVPAIFSAIYFDELSKLNEDVGAKEILKSSKKDVLTLNASVNLVDVDTLQTYEVIFNTFGIH